MVHSEEGVINMARKKGGWFKESRRHSLASRGIETRRTSTHKPRTPRARSSTAHDFPKITASGRVVPMSEYPEFKRASKDAYGLGQSIGSKGISDEDAGAKAFDKIHASVVKVVGRKQDIFNPDYEWDTVYSYLWDDFWRGWSDGYQGER